MVVRIRHTDIDHTSTLGSDGAEMLWFSHNMGSVRILVVYGHSVVILAVPSHFAVDDTSVFAKRETRRE